MQFSLHSSVSPPDVHVHMDGELDIFTARQVTTALTEAMASGARRAVIDAAGVTFVDASALGVLVRARELMRTVSGSMEIVAYSPVFLRLCMLTGLLPLLSTPDESAEGEPARVG